MKKLHKRYKITDDIVEFEEGHRRRLCSNNVSVRCPSSDFIISKSKDELLNELADLFVDSILWEVEHGDQFEKGSDLLPSFNKRTS